jgi:uncharacterized delta-60 repeat protein
VDAGAEDVVVSAEANESGPSVNVRLDSTFGTLGELDGDLSTWTPLGVAIDGTGRVLVSGPQSAPLSPAGEAVFRAMADGTTDMTFGVAGRAVLDVSAALYPQSLRSLADGSIGLLGGDSNEDGTSTFAVRLGADGSLDSALSGQPLLTSQQGPFSTGLWQDDGSSFVFGGLAVVRYDAAGQVVAGYGTSGALPAATAGSVTSDGKLWTLSGSHLIRYLADGSLDDSFGTQGSLDISTLPGSPPGLDLEELVAEPNGGVVVVGSHPSGAELYVDLARLASSGQPAPTFAAGGVLSVQASGGAPVWASQLADGRLFVLSATGEILSIASDGTFEDRTELGVYGTILAAADDGKGHLVIVGSNTDDPSVASWFVRRYLLF